MKDVILVEIERAFEQLFHVELDLADLESDRGVFEHAVQVVIHVWLDHVNVTQLASLSRRSKGHVDDGHDAWVLELLQQLDLAQSCDGQAVLGVVDRNFFECDLGAGEEVSTLEHFTKGALAELDRDLVVIEGRAADKFALIKRYRRGARFASLASRLRRSIGQFSRKARESDGRTCRVVERFTGDTIVGIGRYRSSSGSTRGGRCRSA